jgi:hypothetical protein
VTFSCRGSHSLEAVAPTSALSMAVAEALRLSRRSPALSAARTHAVSVTSLPRNAASAGGSRKSKPIGLPLERSSRRLWRPWCLTVVSRLTLPTTEPNGIRRHPHGSFAAR